MNERIRKLAEQSEIKVAIVLRVCGTDLTEWQQEHLAQLEKFAELIVEEFRGVLSEEYRKTPLECCGHFLRADEAIAKHFYGIK